MDDYDNGSVMSSCSEHSTISNLSCANTVATTDIETCISEATEDNEIALRIEMPDNDQGPITIQTEDDMTSDDALAAAQEEDTENKLKEYKKKLRSARSLSGKHDIAVADILINIGEFHERQTEYNKALGCYEEALHIYSSKLGDDQSRSIDTRVRMGHLHVLRDEDELALDLFCQALFMRNALKGDSHPTVSDLWYDLSCIHRARGQPDIALIEVKRALGGYREAYGDMHSTVAKSVEDIASLYAEVGNFKKSD
eukprot:896598-Ditylum_brightwellii.AAC.1